jgi:hypothetical protein
MKNSLIHSLVISGALFTLSSTLISCKTNNAAIADSSGLEAVRSAGSPLAISCAFRGSSYFLQYNSDFNSGKLLLVTRGSSQNVGSIKYHSVTVSGGKEKVLVKAVKTGVGLLTFQLQFDAGSSAGSGSLSGPETITFSSCEYEGTLTASGGAPIDEPISGAGRPSSGEQKNCFDFGQEIYCSGGTTTNGCPSGQQRCR